MSFDYTPKSSSGQSGIMFNTKSEDSFGSLAYVFDSANNKVTFYNNVKEGDFGTKNFEVPFEFTNGTTYHCELYYENQSAVLYIDDEIALSARVYAAKNNPFSVFANNKKVTFENIKFYE